ncbi:C2 domain-containing protein [Periconia macrospinosa]|uniref:C2 domain-containing protein n=1 Tax=Periconia macrospinosa TaxID=97972 RepID=A0A2V1DH21_9PLEO|nr:C2 domain-containing protein [Periconia macrospinosa]
MPDDTLPQSQHPPQPESANGNHAATAEKTEEKLGAAADGDEGPPPKPLKTRTSSSKKEKQPEGGFDDTPVPYAPPGYTIKITFHRACNLPLADINTLSADPFIVAELITSLPTRHKEDPPLQLRTPTVRQNTDPVWNTQWIIANVPASGFRLKCRIYDEDPADHDDRLGNAHVVVDSLNDQWPGIKEQRYSIKKRMGSKRAYLLRAVAVCFNKVQHMTGSLYVSVELLGKTEGDHGGRVYTVGPQFWIRHFSPMLGRLLGQKEPNIESSSSSHSKGKSKAERYNFQANEMQLRGPVPEAMYHRYVEFKPFVKSMFTAKGVRGFILSKALHHQHARVYNFDRETEYESLPEPCKEFTQKFLELVHYDQGGRIFTYVLTLDGLFRFTETGKEFGIDMLSKHTMHSNVAAYTAFSGEFFIRRLKYPSLRPPEEGGHNSSHPPDTISGGPPQDEPTKDPSYYELIIDNDSGTYRPNAKLLPQLKSFFEANFPGLKIVTIDCQGDAEKMEKLKEEQRELKKAEGDHIVYAQASRSSSMSSSDIEELDRLEQLGERPEPHLRHQLIGAVDQRVDAAKIHAKAYKPGKEAWKMKNKPAKQDDTPQAQPPTEAEKAENSHTEGPPR